ncbi:MAG TPA: ABC transporter substrate-binding protein [Bacillales bacterium]|nr:ABC transporter substrate-binding protein [Bacillales bacterium]
MKHLKKYILLLAVPLLLLGACSSQGNANGGSGVDSSGKKQTIMFADAGWASLRFHNWVARTIIEEGYGYPTDVTTGSSTLTIRGLRQGDIDAYMEIWTQNVKVPWQKALESGKVKKVSVNYDDNKQGYFVPTYMIKGDKKRGIKATTPNLKTTKDLLKYADVFPKGSTGKSLLYGAPLGWAVAKVCQQQMDKYGLNEKFHYFQPGSATSLKASLKRAYQNGKPWVGYMWGPTWMLGKYDMTRLKGSFPQNDVLVAVNKNLSKRAPKVVKFLSHYHTSAKITNNALVYMHKNDAKAKQAAKWWLRNHPDIWTKWVPDDVAKKVKNAL